MPEFDTPGSHGETVYILPVGLEYDCLITPITSGEIDADRVVLVYSETEPELATEFRHKLRGDLTRFVRGVELEEKQLSHLYRFETLYRECYSLIREELDNSRDESGTLGQDSALYINISSLPATLAVTLTLATNTIMLENPTYREHIHIYYFPPERDLFPELIDELRDTESLLSELQDVQEIVINMIYDYVIDDLQAILERLDERMNVVTDEANVDNSELGDIIERLQTQTESLRSDFDRRTLYRLEDDANQLSATLNELQSTHSDHESITDQFGAMEIAANDLIQKAQKIQEDLITEQENLPYRIEMVSNQLDQQLASTRNLLSQLQEHGRSGGVRDDEQHYIEVPSLLDPNLRSVEGELLILLDEVDQVDSITRLAQELATYRNEEYDESLKSTVQYNVRSLEEKGYVTRDKSGRSHKIQLSKMGDLWLSIHDQDSLTSP